ncbi:MAG: hypothetical protein DRN99_09960 [Thermoproteota archaeon]|nr:MAG: hypothetical protein DRN99_09960 [Candidatus Korarchaeota archaeon]
MGVSQLDLRSGKLVVVAHCLLNPNTKVLGVARRSSALWPLLKAIEDHDCSIFQLPCPELGYYGYNRFWATVEQLDTPGFRRYCRKLATLALDSLVELARNGIRILALVGVEGSPSCAVGKTTSGSWRGDPHLAGETRKVSKPGVFMAELIQLMREAGLDAPALDIREKSPEEGIRQLRLILRGSA